MAKLLKHLGFGGKKAPPQPPKPDYSAVKSQSTESSLARSPTSERSSTTMSTAGSHIGDFEVAQLQGSPAHRMVQSTSSSEKAFGGARPKDSGGVSPKSVDRLQMRSAGSVDEPETPAASENVNSVGKPRKKGTSATPVSIVQPAV